MSRISPSRSIASLGDAAGGGAITPDRNSRAGGGTSTPGGASRSSSTFDEAARRRSPTSQTFSPEEDIAAAAASSPNHHLTHTQLHQHEQSGRSVGVASHSSGTVMHDKDDIIAAAAAASGVDISEMHRQQQEGKKNNNAKKQSSSSPTARQPSASLRRIGGGGGGGGGASVGAGGGGGGDAQSIAGAGAGLPGFTKLGSRKPTVGGRMAAARIHSGINQHEVASKCGVPVNKIFNIEKGLEEDLERWATKLAHISIALGVPFTEVIGDYVTCVSNPVLVADPVAAAVAGGGSASVVGAASPLAATQPWKLTVGGRVRHAREGAKVAADVLTEMLSEGLGGEGISKEELEELEMCDSTAEDSIPVLLYVVYRTGMPLASLVL